MDDWSNHQSTSGNRGVPDEGRGSRGGYNNHNNNNNRGRGISRYPGWQEGPRDNAYYGRGRPAVEGPRDNAHYGRGRPAVEGPRDNAYYGRGRPAVEGPRDNAYYGSGRPAVEGPATVREPRPSGSGTAAGGNRVRRIPFPDLVPPLEDNDAGEIAFQNISQIWDVSKCAGDVQKALEEAYRSNGNPYSMGLFLMVRCKDFLGYQINVKGPWLSLIVIQELEKYVESLNNSKLDIKIQMAALRLAAKQRNKELESLLVKVFKIKETETEVINFIRGLVEAKEYEEACLLSIAARIDCFDIHEFLTPLFFQDKVYVVENYLEFSKATQDKMTAFVDEFLYHGGNVDFNLDQYIKINNLTVTQQQRSKKTEKSLKKLLKKWTTKFGNPSAAPNVQQSVGCGQIKYLISQRYELDSLAEANFLELIASCIRSDTTSSAAEYTFRSILNYGDTAAAVKLVREHNIDISNTPEYIRSVVERGLEAESDGSRQPATGYWEDENWETGETIVRQFAPKERASDLTATTVANVYQLPIPVTSIHIISDEAEVAQFCSYINNRLQCENVLESGFDCEWKSILPDCAALLQISFSGVVFLVDLFTLRNQAGCETRFDLLVQNYFSNPRILKLGYDYGHDISMLSKVHPTLSKLRLSIKNAVDIRILKAKIIQKIPDFFEGLNSSGEVKEGLSDFIFQCLGKTLSKDEQISDWERRPLRESQIIYAAADCYCLLDVYHFLKNTDSVKSYGIQELLQN